MTNEQGRETFNKGGLPAGQATDGDALTAGGSKSRRPGAGVVAEPSLDHRGNVFFAAIEMMRVPMILTDPRQPDNPVVFANNACLDLTGYELEDMVGRNCRFLQGADTEESSVREMREAIRNERAISLEILNYRRDGTPFWNAIFIGPVFDEAGDILYFFASALDVTRRRESEQNLRQSQKIDSIGQLTAGLAHDFNNLLQVISGSLEMMALKREDEEAFKRYHAGATAAADRGAKLTGQLLAFARPSRLQPKRVELSGVIDSIAELLDTSVGWKAELKLDLHRGLPEILIDPLHLEMALINIAVNARDAMPTGGTITIATAPAKVGGGVGEDEVPGLAPGAYVRLEVADEGTGMEPHVLARAIEPFFSTKARGSATGLGLAMAQAFARQSGGILRIESEPGRGTIARFYFPQAPAEEERPAIEVKSDVAPRQLSETAPLVLIVEDNVEIAAIARETLTEAGYRTLVAHDAEAGLATFRETTASGRIDLVFTDLIMPGGNNGVALAHQIRALAPEVPILLTTGYNDDMSIDGPRPEALDVLGKPYRRSELVDRVQAAIRRGVRTGPARSASEFGVARE